MALDHPVCIHLTIDRERYDLWLPSEIDDKPNA